VARSWKEKREIVSVFQHALQKTARRFVAGLIEKLPRRGAFGNFAVSHERDEIGGVACESHFMGHKDDGLFGTAQLGNDIQNLGGHFGIESGGGFIKQEELGIDSERTRDGDALALTAAELGGLLAGVVE
jgi:hypothetical protein